MERNGQPSSTADRAMIVDIPRCLHTLFFSSAGVFATANNHVEYSAAQTPGPAVHPLPSFIALFPS